MERKRKNLLVLVFLLIFTIFGTSITRNLSTGDFVCKMAFAEEEVEESKLQTSDLELIKGYITEADKLMKEKTIENFEEAIKKLESVLEIDPDNYEALCKIANAYVDILTIKTSGLIIEKDEYKPMLKELGKKADIYARRALEINPNEKEAIAAAALSHGYYSASFGIVKAILKGAAGRYKKLTRKLIEIDDSYEGALGYKMLGKLYYMAPFPVGSKKKAIKFYKKALAIDNSLLVAHYYLGMIYLKKKEYDLAKQEFDFVINNPPNKVEEYYIDEFKKESRKRFDQIVELETEE